MVCEACAPADAGRFHDHILLLSGLQVARLLRAQSLHRSEHVLFLREEGRRASVVWFRRDLLKHAARYGWRFIQSQRTPPV
jgi:hypothetical protein